MEVEKDFVQELLLWFEGNKRWMPWRQTKDPYHIWISEVMLQQTRVETVITYYQRFTSAFPTVAHLAEATEEEVLKLWEGLGYYARGKNLRKAAIKVMEEHQGKLPMDKKQLLKLPGIGEYTAGAIMSIAFNQPIPAVDGNVMRVYSRLHAIEADILDPKTMKQVYALVEEDMPPGRYGDFSEALMELGALVCTPQNPKCEGCPVVNFCKAKAQGRVDQIPLRKVKTKVKQLKQAVLWITQEERVLLRKNPPGGLLGSLWALPTFTFDHFPDPLGVMEALAAKGLDLDYPPLYEGKFTHIFTHQRWEIGVFSLRLPREGHLDQLMAEGYQWIEMDQMQELTLPTLYHKAIKLLNRS